MSGEGADYLVHFEVEEDGGGFGEGEGGGGGYLVEGEMVACFQSVDNLLLVGGEFRSVFHLSHGYLFAQEGPAELEGYVVGVADEEGAVGGDEVVGAARIGVGEATWDGEDFALVAGSDGGGDEGTAFL